jgi:hypothetical protein
MQRILNDVLANKNIFREALTLRAHRKMFPSLKLLTAKQFFWDNKDWSLSDDAMNVNVKLEIRKSKTF